MLEFKSHLAVITSLDYDHPDTYATKEEYRQAFVQFVKQSDSAIGWGGGGLSEDNLKLLDTVDPEITLHGDHNKSNATLVLKSVQKLFPNVEKDKILEALNNFPGTERRFERLSNNLYTDYAHHPTEIASTIQLAKELNKNVVIVYQPHQNIRQHHLLKDGGYKNAFKGAAKVYWLPTYLSREDEKLKTLSATKLIESNADNSFIQKAEMNDDLKKKIEEHLSNGNLVVTMSAGDLDGWIRRLADNN